MTISYQINLMKSYNNDVSLRNNSDVNVSDVNFIENFKFYAIVKLFRAIRRKKHRENQKIKKLKIVKFMHIKIIIVEHRIIALLNSNNEINLISHRFAKQINLTFDMKKTITLFIINDKRVNTYDVHFLNLKVNDKHAHIRYFHEFFLVSNVTHEKIMLNMS